MNPPILLKRRERLSRELVSWQIATAGILVLSVACNMAMAAHIGQMEDQYREAIAGYEVRIDHMENIRDMALRQLGALALQAEADAKARAEQAAAYETIGVYQYIGECTVTAYCPCVECCGKWADGLTATGIPAEPGIVAVDPERIPLGSTVVIDGQKYLAADTGVTGLHVDVCLADHASTVEHGVRMAQVWVVEDDEW
ncbi:MAG: 3D domain-containing protein [Oscillospiraceae bacterium]|nr:3D domain-containing protein [Oscillospiraceae bacterium]